MIKRESVLRILEERKTRLANNLIGDALEVELDVLINKIKNLPEEDEWIPINEDDLDTFPKTDDYILVSFENFILPDIARYEADEDGGAFYPGDMEESYSSIGLIVSAWQPLPKCYTPET